MKAKQYVRYMVFILSIMPLLSGCGKIWGGINAYKAPGGGSYILNPSSISNILGSFAGALGLTTASTGTCPAAGATNSWCTGGTFGSAITDGTFNHPRGVAVDSINGFFYVTDYTNHRVDKINLSTGVFVGSIGNTTATGGTCPAAGAAPGWCTGGTFASAAIDGGFNSPTGIAVDPTGGFLYVADSLNARIVKINLNSGAFVGAIGNTTATSGTCPAAGIAPGWCTGGTFTGVGLDGSYEGPEGIAIDTLNNYLYVADNSDSKVSKVTLSTGAFYGAIGMTTGTTGTCPGGNLAAPGWCTGGGYGAGTGDGMFSNPLGVAIDSANNFLYITDSSNHRIEKVSSTSGAFIGSLGKTTASTGTCPAAGVALGWCTGGTFGSAFIDGAYGTPWGVAVDSTSGFLYVTDYSHSSVNKIIAGAGTFVGSIGTLLGTTGTCPAAGAAPNWCTGGTFIGGGAGDGMFTNPTLIGLDSTGSTLYLPDYSNHRIDRFK